MLKVHDGAVFAIGHLKKFLISNKIKLTNLQKSKQKCISCHRRREWICLAQMHCQTIRNDVHQEGWCAARVFGMIPQKEDLVGKN